MRGAIGPDAVIRALRAAPGLRNSELLAATGMEQRHLALALAKLVRARAILCRGATTAGRWSLAPVLAVALDERDDARAALAAAEARAERAERERDETRAALVGVRKSIGEAAERYGSALNDAAVGQHDMMMGARTASVAFVGCIDEVLAALRVRP